MIQKKKKLIIWTSLNLKFLSVKDAVKRIKKTDYTKGEQDLYKTHV